MYKEITSKRTPAGRHYVDGSGRGRFVTIAGTILNYDNGGGLAGVDMRAQRVTTAALDGWRVNKNGWHFAIGKPGDQDTDGWIGFGGRGGDSWIRFRLARAGFVHWPKRAYTNLATANYDRANLSRRSEYIVLPDGDHVYPQTRIEWAGVMPGVDLRWIAEGRGLKEEIIIAPAALAALLDPETAIDQTYAAMIFEIEAGAVARWIGRDGKPKTIANGFETDDPIEARDQAGDLIAFMPLDYAYLESDPDRRVRLRRRFYRKNGRDYLIVGARVDKLQALAAADPESAIIFDPTYETQPDATAGKDTYLDKDTPLSSRGSSNYLRFSAKRASLIEFDLSSISDSNACDSAELALIVADQALDSSAEMDAYSLASGVSDWTEADANWNKYKSATAWPGSAGAETAGTDYESGSIGNVTGPAATGTTVTVDLDTTRIESWFGLTNTNYGLKLARVAGTFSYWSSDYGTALSRPKLTVEYTEPLISAAAGCAAVAPSVGMSSQTVTPAAAAVGCAAAVDSVLVASIPPVLLGYIGDVYLMSAGPQVSIALLVTAGDYWRLVDSANAIEAIGAEITRHSGHLTPE